jgi:hypothetical protein
MAKRTNPVKTTVRQAPKTLKRNDRPTWPNGDLAANPRWPSRSIALAKAPHNADTRFICTISPVSAACPIHGITVWERQPRSRTHWIRYQTLSEAASPQKNINIYLDALAPAKGTSQKRLRSRDKPMTESTKFHHHYRSVRLALDRLDHEKVSQSFLAGRSYHTARDTVNETFPNSLAGLLVNSRFPGKTGASCRA